MKNYLIDRKDLMSEWDNEKNRDLNPSLLTLGSHTKAWWKCKEGHSWNSSIANRARLSRGCPYCTHQLPIVGVNDLQTLYPEICKEIHPAKNGDIDTSTIMPGTHKELWFVCPKCGSDYKMRVYHRIKGMGCPVCANKKVVKGINDLATTNPELAKEWHPTKNGILTPYQVSRRSGRKVWWLCPVGHEYQCTVDNRGGGKNCPVCQKTMRTSFPEQAIFYYVKKQFPDAINGYKKIFNNRMELDVYIPSIKVGVEYDGMAYHSSKEKIKSDINKYAICKQNGIYLIRVREKPYEEEIRSCDLLLVLKTFTNSVDLNREIYHVLLSAVSKKNISHVIFGDNRSPFEQMLESAKLMDVDVDRDRRKIQQYLNKFEDSLAKYRPDLIEEWDFDKNKPLTPFNVKPFSNEKVWWKCKKCGREWKTMISARTRADKSNCPDCSYKIGGIKHHQFLLKKNGSLSVTHPHLIEKWDFDKNIISPDDVVAGSSKKVWWKCKKCGHSWLSSVCHMAERNSNCPACQHKVCVPGLNDLATEFPELVKDWDYSKNNVSPSEITSSGKKAFWKCNVCGHEWEAVIISRVKGAGCPKCAIKRRIGNQFARKK